MSEFIEALLRGAAQQYVKNTRQFSIFGIGEYLEKKGTTHFHYCYSFELYLAAQLVARS